MVCRVWDSKLSWIHTPSERDWLDIGGSFLHLHSLGRYKVRIGCRVQFYCYYYDCSFSGSDIVDTLNFDGGEWSCIALCLTSIKVGSWVTWQQGTHHLRQFNKWEGGSSILRWFSMKTEESNFNQVYSWIEMLNIFAKNWSNYFVRALICCCTRLKLLASHVMWFSTTHIPQSIQDDVAMRWESSCQYVRYLITEVIEVFAKVPRF